MKGTIIRMIPNKGFCFVRGEEDGLTRFALARSFKPMVDFERAREGSAVEFTPVKITKDPKGNGLRAEDIILC
jgi:hypothetical protein